MKFLPLTLAGLLLFTSACFAERGNCTAPAENTCVKFGEVTVYIQQQTGHPLKRAVLFSTDMKRDALDFVLATGFLMTLLDQHSTADERSALFKTMMKTKSPIRWGGHLWQLSYSETDAIRVVVERE